MIFPWSFSGPSTDIYFLPVSVSVNSFLVVSFVVPTCPWYSSNVAISSIVISVPESKLYSPFISSSSTSICLTITVPSGIGSYQNIITDGSAENTLFSSSTSVYSSSPSTSFTYTGAISSVLPISTLALLYPNTCGIGVSNSFDSNPFISCSS